MMLWVAAGYWGTCEPLVRPRDIKLKDLVDAAMEVSEREDSWASRVRFTGGYNDEGLNMIWDLLDHEMEL
jgi:hypothetical protein